jgi:hypothetical protein
MNKRLLRWSAIACGIGLFAVLSVGCVVDGGGYAYDGGAIGADYYEPYGAVYGGWGPGFHVAPFRGGDHRSAGGAHAFRSAPASRPMPSIPSGARSGGGRRR